MCVNPKYTIKQRIRQLPGAITQNRYLLCIQLDISDKTLDNWCNTEKGARFSIPSDALFKLADIFNCNPTDLING